MVIRRVRSRLTFQFTHPVRGATSIDFETKELSGFQFTHPVRGATHVARVAAHLDQVSIHAPREGCDTKPPRYLLTYSRFNSRTP